MTLDPNLAARLEKLKALPSPPRVAMRILEVARDPDVRLAQVADVVTADPVITAKIMRTANSVAYARPGGCTTLRQALLLLGLDATLIIALSFSLVMNLRRDRLGGLDHELYWRRSLLAAAAARALGRALGRHDCEALFLAALLQDIGMLALDRLDENTYTDAGERQRDHRAIAEYERERLGSDHAAVGAWLMQRWGLPDSVSTAISASHEPLSEEHDSFAHCVALAGPLADVWLASDWSLSFRDLVGIAVDSLGINHVQLGMVLDDLRTQIPETEAMFEKDLIDPAEEFTALEEAREMLMTLGVEGFMKATAPPSGGSGADAPVTLLRMHHREEIVEAMQREAAEAQRAGDSAALVVARLDGLDDVRAAHGADGAERVVREAALAMLDNGGARVVGQSANDELALWLANIGEEGAELAIRRMERTFVEALAALTGDERPQVDLHIGVATLDQVEPTRVDAMLSRARATMTPRRSEQSADAAQAG